MNFWRPFCKSIDLGKKIRRSEDVRLIKEFVARIKKEKQ